MVRCLTSGTPAAGRWMGQGDAANFPVPAHSGGSTTATFSFDRGDLRTTIAHGGPGEILVERVVDRAPGAAGLTFVDLAIVPPGASIGTHTHGNDEELYVIIEGNGSMTLDGDVVEVGPGDVVVNPPGGTHGLVNTGGGPMRIVVVDVAAAGDSVEAAGPPQVDRG